MSSQTARTLTELFELLRNQPEDVAFEALQSIRQGRSPGAIVQWMGGGVTVSSVSPSALATNRSLLPPTQTPLEFELVVQHPSVYPSLVPLDLASLDLQLLDIPPLAVDRREGTGSSLLPRMQGATEKGGRTVDPKAIMAKGFDGNAIDTVDARLEQLDITPWTNIAISNRFAAEAITLYLQMNQPWWAFFDTDLFLEDLIRGQTRFCSRLLVNAILAWSTVSSRNRQTACILESLWLTLPISKAMPTTSLRPRPCRPNFWVRLRGCTKWNVTWIDRQRWRPHR